LAGLISKSYKDIFEQIYFPKGPIDIRVGIESSTEEKVIFGYKSKLTKGMLGDHVLAKPFTEYKIPFLIQ
jgi:hypothetical protein